MVIMVITPNSIPANFKKASKLSEYQLLSVELADVLRRIENLEEQIRQFRVLLHNERKAK